MNQFEDNNHQLHDWSLLPSDIANKIAELLTLQNRVYFRMVCKSWCTSVPPVRIPSPWLLFPGGIPKEYTNFFTFYSRASDLTFQYPAPPEISDTNYVGSRDGWLVVSDLSYNIYILDPLTGVQIDLPSYFNRNKIRPEYENDYATYRIFKTCRFSRLESPFTKIVLSSNLTPTNFMAVALFGRGNVAYTRAGDMMWHAFEDETPLKIKGIYDIAFSKGKFWILMPDLGILSIDLTHSGLPEVKVVLEGYKTNGFSLITDIIKFIVISDYSDEIFMILPDGNIQVDLKNECRFHTDKLIVRRFNGRSHPPRWDPVIDLGGQSFFIGNNNYFSLSTKDVPRLGGDCIFFTDILDGNWRTSDMGVFDMTKQSFELMFPSNLESNWIKPPPIWFQSRLT